MLLTTVICRDFPGESWDYGGPGKPTAVSRVTDILDIL